MCKCKLYVIAVYYVIHYHACNCECKCKRIIYYNIMIHYIIVYLSYYGMLCYISLHYITIPIPGTVRDALAEAAKLLQPEWGISGSGTQQTKVVLFRDRDLEVTK